MTASNVKLLGASHTDDVTLYVTSENASYPKENLQIAQGSTKWRSTSAALQTLWADFGGLKGCSGFSLSGHNLSVDANIRVTLYKELTSVSITGATHSAGIVTVTTSGFHGVYEASKAGNGIKFTGVAGMTDLNDQIFDVYEVVDANNIKVELTTAQSYTSGGTSLSLTEQYDNTDQAFYPRYGWGEAPWGLDGWGGYSINQDYPDFSMRWFGGVIAQYMRIEIDDTTNADGYVEAGRLKIGNAWTPQHNFDWGTTMDVTEDTKLYRTRGGSLRSSARPAYKTMEFRFSWLTENDGLTLIDILNDIGMRGDVLVSAYPGAGTSLERATTIIGRIVSHTPLVRRKHGYGMSIYIEEAL